jgi:hypothetical protein
MHVLALKTNISASRALLKDIIPKNVAKVRIVADLTNIDDKLLVIVCKLKFAINIALSLSLEIGSLSCRKSGILLLQCFLQTIKAL